MYVQESVSISSMTYDYDEKARPTTTGKRGGERRGEEREPKTEERELQRFEMITK
jgi:hypothetical protein